MTVAPSGPLTLLFLGIIAISISFFTRIGDPIHVIAGIWAKSILMESVRNVIRGDFEKG